jgi:hypothetical protein
MVHLSWCAIQHTSRSHEGARIHLATLCISKQSIFAFPSSLASSESHILVIEGFFERRFVSRCLGREVVYTLILGCGGLLLLVHRVFLICPGGEHDFRVAVVSPVSSKTAREAVLIISHICRVHRFFTGHGRHHQVTPLLTNSGSPGSLHGTREATTASELSPRCCPLRTWDSGSRSFTFSTSPPNISLTRPVNHHSTHSLSISYIYQHSLIHRQNGCHQAGEPLTPHPITYLPLNASLSAGLQPAKCLSGARITDAISLPSA